MNTLYRFEGRRAVATACALAIASSALFVEKVALAQSPPPPPPANVLQYGGGGVYGRLTLVPVFWTNQVATDVQQNIASSLNLFLSSRSSDPSVVAVCASLSEYDEASPSSNQPLESGGTATTGVTITPTQQPTCTGTNNACSASNPCGPGAGTCTGGFCRGSGATCGLNSPCGAGAGTCQVTQLQVSTELDSQMTNGILPKAGTGGNNYFYMVFLPPGIDSDQGAGCGVHFKGNFGSTTYPLSTITDGSHYCQNGANAVSAYQQLSLTAAHELYETMTDPFSGTGWTVPNAVPEYGGQEMGDLCDTHPAILPAGNVKQRTWSNKYAECINGMAWVAPSFTRFATQSSGNKMGLFWATGDGGIAMAGSPGNGTWGSAAEIAGSNVPGPGQSCYWDSAGYNTGNSGPSHIPIQFTCFEGGNPVGAASAGNSGVIKVFGAMNGGINEFVTGTGTVTEAKKSNFNNGGDVGSGFPVAAVDAQLGNGEVRVAWTTNQGGIDVGLINGDDSVFELKQNLAPPNSIMPGTSVSMIVPAPGKAMVFWAQGGIIWELSYDCLFQPTCAKGAGTWFGPTNVDTIAGVVPNAPVSAVQQSAGSVSLFWTKLSLNGAASVWTKSFNFLTGWTGDTDLYDVVGFPVHPGSAPPGADIVAVSTTPGGITIVFPNLSGGGLSAGVLPPGLGTTAFGPLQQVAGAAALTTTASVITAIPNANGANNELTLWWQSSQGASMGTVQGAQFNGISWGGVTTLGGALMVP